ncbi:MAG: transposase, partial [Firmicutes bacterium]|nr:transposase [Bacillota bacterium]
FFTGLGRFEKTEEFRQKYRERSGIERKNAEMKRFHGLARAKGYGLRGVTLQAKFTAIVVNLKRIAKIVSSVESIIDWFFSPEAATGALKRIKNIGAYIIANVPADPYFISNTEDERCTHSARQ